MKLPEHRSLVAQTIGVLREAITTGEWLRWLPGEIALAQRLHVSRVTVRSALAVLEREKLISGGAGRRREINLRLARRPATLANRTVALLSPVPLHRLPTSIVFWMDELREHLDAAGWPLEIRVSASVYRRRPAHALDELTLHLRPAGWVLYHSTPEMQQWFSDHGHRAIIAGSQHPGVGLPSVDIDYAAGCRHAAGRMLAAGHRRLAIVRPDTALAGDLESVAGFQAAAGPEVQMAIHDGTVRGICTALDRLFTPPPHPTGLFVFHAEHVLTVLGWLQQHGRHVPADVSILCRDDEPFLGSVVPALTRYTLNAELFARKISRLVVEMVTSGSVSQRRQRILPHFEPGETLSAPGAARVPGYSPQKMMRA